MKPDLFYDQFPSLDTFTLGKINFFKVFYNAWSGLESKTLSKHTLSKTYSASYLLKHWGKYVSNCILGKHRGKILFYTTSTNRIVEDGGVFFDQYAATIINDTNRSDFVIWEDYLEEKQPKANLMVWYGFLWRGLLRSIAVKVTLLTLSRKIRQFWETNQQGLSRLGFTEEQTRGILIDFFLRYSGFLFWLFLSRPIRVLFLCHYGREPFIAACGSLNIPCIELQHGHITQEHSKYSYPRIDPRISEIALFPDEMWTWGKFWSENLQLGQFPAKIRKFGYYVYWPKHTEIEHKPVILITSQWTVTTEIIALIEHLLANIHHTDYEIWIKPHPQEAIEDFSSVAEEPRVVIKRDSVYHLLPQASIHITVYSTTAYEALRFGVPKNFVLLTEEYEAQSLAIANSGAAYVLKKTDLPWDNLAGIELMPASYFFSEIAHNLLQCKQLCSD
jgi:hypothetical protein